MNQFYCFIVCIMSIGTLWSTNGYAAKPAQKSLADLLSAYDHVTWKQALANKPFFAEGIGSALALLGCGKLFNSLADFIRDRPGTPLYDPLLNCISPQDMSIPAFLLTYGGILTGTCSILQSPVRAVKTAQLFAVAQLMRIICICLVPLEPPEGGVRLRDPFLEFFFYKGRPLRKDLFFSGHTANLFTFFFLVKNKKLKLFFLVASCLIGIAMLIQHGHYTIDVLAAPFFVWLSSKIVEQIPVNWSFASDQKEEYETIKDVLVFAEK